MNERKNNSTIEFQPFETSQDEDTMNRVEPNTTQRSGQVLNYPSASDSISKSIAENPIPSPYFDRIRQNEKRRQILSTMPVKDENGRIKSGLRGLLEELAGAFDPKFGIARNWTDFSARLARAGGKGLGGAINPTWDEEADRQTEISKIDDENERLMEIGQKDFQIRSQAATFGLNQQKEQNRQNNDKTRQEQRNRELDLREARQNFQRLNTDQKTVLSSILKRGYYREGINKEEDARITELGIILPDFDSRKPITKEQGGKFFQYDFDTENWKEAQGLPVDESEVPIEFSISGQRMKLRPRDIAGIEAAKERQTSQQQFTANENEKSRNFAERMKNITNENDAVSQVNQAIKDGQKRIAENDLTQDQFKVGIKTLINMFGEPIKSKLLERFSKEVN